MCGDKSHLEAVKEVVELLRREVPGQLGQKVVYVLHNGLMFTSLPVKQCVNKKKICQRSHCWFICFQAYISHRENAGAHKLNLIDRSMLR